MQYTVSPRTVYKIAQKKAYTVWNYTVRDYYFKIGGPKMSKIYTSANQTTLCETSITY